MKFENPSSNSLMLTGPVRAAQYVRMSTEHQRYSISSQTEAISDYATYHGIEIVCTYADRGRSGLDLRNRPALQQLLQDVVGGHANFSLILVYDVSRWGRFQDADEAAHYEFVCRQAGINVEYCAEQFDNDGNPIAALLKSMKRIMAAEYSRELSKKVHVAQCQVASKGYWAGGQAGLGYRRVMIDDAGERSVVLETGEHKIISSGHIVLVPGPPKEISLIRYMFRQSAAGKSYPEIAAALNRRGKLTVRGNLWSPNTVAYTLKNEKYVGTLLWNRKSSKLSKRKKVNPKSDWIRVEGAFEPIISRELFNKARQATRVRRQPPPEHILLEGLQRLLNEKGRLSKELIRADKRTPGPACYVRVFGRIQNAYARIGYTPKQKFRYPEVDRFSRNICEENALCAAKKFHQIVNGGAKLVHGAA